MFLGEGETTLATPHVTAKATKKGTGSHCAIFHKVREGDMMAVELSREISLAMTREQS